MKSIFVSSTFKDMHEERDILHKRVIPELNEYATQYGESVSLCDLRWGVNTEDLDSEEGSRKVLSVCLDEIDRCRPYMIVLLGERYGWIPEPETLREIEKTRSGMNLKDLEKSVTALEIEYGDLENKQQLEHTLFYFREFEGAVPEKYGREDARHERKLSELKERIRNLAGNRVHTYTVSWDAEKNTLKGLENFAEQITADLKELLEEKWKEYALLTPFERDQRLQWDFAQQKSDQFRAREELIDQYLNKLNQGQNLLAISGASGSGKSTLIGRLAVRLQEEGKEVLPIFCGSTMFCNDAMDVIRYIVRHIEDYFFLEHYEEKKQRDIEELTFGDKRWDRENRTDTDCWTDRLAEMCVLYAEKSDREMIILIDALDQLFPDEIRDRLRFIPTNLSDKVKIVCSFLDNFDTGYHKKWKQVEQLLPLDETDKKAVIDGILHSHQERELPLPVIEKIMTKKGSDNPLYLSLEVQRLAMMDQDDYEKMTATGDEMDSITAYEMAVVDKLPENLEELCMHLMCVASEKLGNNMAELAVRYIAVSRYGLRETDLEGIFTDQGIEWNSLDFTLFLRYMKSFFLLRDDGRWDFTHQCIRIGVLKNVVNEEELHKQILDYLKKQDKKDEVRISEIIYHCWRANDKNFFVQYVHEYEQNEEIIQTAARITYEMVMLNEEKWLCSVIENGKHYGIEEKFFHFLNFDLDGNFRKIVKKDLCVQEIIFDKAVELEKVMLETKETSNCLFELSISYSRLGDICVNRKEMGYVQKAQDMYEKSLDIFKKLKDIESHSDRFRNLSIGYLKVGDICVKQGGEEALKKAQEMYERSIEFRELWAEKVGTKESLCELAKCYYVLGNFYVKRKENESLPKAQEMYEKSLDIFKFVAEREETTESFNHLINSYYQVGKVCLKQGGKENLQKAWEMYEQGLKIHEIQSKKGESNLVAFAFICQMIGSSWYWQGGKENLFLAKKMYEKALDIWGRLLEQNTTFSETSLIQLSIVHEKIGNIYELLGGTENIRKAIDEYISDISILKEIIKIEERSDMRITRINDLQESLEKVGDLCYGLNDIRDLYMAQRMYRRSLKIEEKLVEKQLLVKISDLKFCHLKKIHRLGGKNKYLRKALEICTKTISVIEKLSTDEDSIENLRNLSDSYMKMGTLFRLEGEKEAFKSAQKAYEKGLSISKEIVNKEGLAIDRIKLSDCYTKMGDVNVEMGEKKALRQAMRMYYKGWEIAEDLVSEDGGVYLYKEQLVATLYKFITFPSMFVFFQRKFLNEMKRILEELFQQTQNQKYQKLLERAKIEFKNI